jgi:integrase/recombinase XerD
MSIQVRSRISRDGQKIWYSFEWGKGPGERQATGMFTYAKPKNQIQKNYNKRILALLEVKLCQKIIDYHSGRKA